MYVRNFDEVAPVVGQSIISKGDRWNDTGHLPKTDFFSRILKLIMNNVIQ